mgnify:CR=1 FL=1
MLINNLGQIEHLIDGYITTNGARCFVGNHTVCLHPILRADVDEVVADADRNDYSVIVVGERHLVVYHPTDIVRKVFVEGLGVVNLDFGTRLDDLKNEEVLQLTPFCSAEQEADLMLRLSNCTSGRWHPAFTDITSGEADKGKGLQVMAEYLGLDISETMAFGDGGNDMQMLQHVSLAVAMGNAGDELKSIADFVTKDVDDEGIAYALKHYGLIDL